MFLVKLSFPFRFTFLFAGFYFAPLALASIELRMTIVSHSKQSTLFESEENVTVQIQHKKNNKLDKNPHSFTKFQFSIISFTQSLVFHLQTGNKNVVKMNWIENRRFYQLNNSQQKIRNFRIMVINTRSIFVCIKLRILVKILF